MPGLTITGLDVPTLEDLRDQFNALFQDLFGLSINVSDRSVEGQAIGINTEALTIIWEAIEAVYSAFNVAKATGAALEALCLLTGTTRRPASFSAVTLSLTGTPTTPVPTGTLVAVDSTARQFQTIEDVIIDAADAWVAATAYDVDDDVTNGGNIYRCITAGTSDASGGPSGTTDDITDNTAHWTYVGAGTGVIDAAAQATETGEIVAVARDITTKVSSIGGWSSVINLLDAGVGNAVMTDAELRALREIELATPGTSPQAAIRAALLEVGKGTSNPVTAASVFMNNTDAIDADGMPPHSVEALVEGGEDQDIWDCLLANVAAGIQTHGTEVGTATDSQGTEQVEKFSRSTDVDIYVAVTLTYDDDFYPDDGDDQVAEAIALYGQELPNGRNVAASALSARVFDVDGVLEVVTMFIGLAPAPVSSTTIPIGLRERAIYDTSRITVSSSAAVP